MGSYQSGSGTKRMYMYNVSGLGRRSCAYRVRCNAAGEERVRSVAGGGRSEVATRWKSGSLPQQQSTCDARCQQPPLSGAPQTRKSDPPPAPFMQLGRGAFFLAQGTRPAQATAPLPAASVGGAGAGSARLCAQRVHAPGPRSGAAHWETRARTAPRAGAGRLPGVAPVQTRAWGGFCGRHVKGPPWARGVLGPLAAPRQVPWRAHPSPGRSGAPRWGHEK